MQTEHRLLPLRAVLARLGVSKPTLYRLIAADRAPRPVRASPGRSGWVEAEVDAMIAGRVAERDAAVAETSARRRRASPLLAAPSVDVSAVE